MASGSRPIENAPLKGRRLLGALLGQRRKELGYTHWPAFARARLPLTPKGNPNTRLLADIEKAYRETFPEDTLRHLARAYQVTYQSLVAVAHLRTEALTPMPDSAPAVPAALPAMLPPMTDAARIASAKPYADAINRRLRDLAGQGDTDPPGGRVFPASPGDAKAWDGIGARMEVDERVWFIADLQRRDDGRDGPGSRSGTA